MRLQAVRGLCRKESLSACLLHNDAVSYPTWRGQAERGGAEAKASLNRANESRGIDPKRDELDMDRMKRG